MRARIIQIEAFMHLISYSSNLYELWTGRTEKEKLQGIFEDSVCIRHSKLNVLVERMCFSSNVNLQDLGLFS